MLLERDQFVARGEEHVKFRNPQGPLAQQLIDAHGETARPLLVQLHGQQPRIGLEGRIVAQAVRGARIAVREQVVPDRMLGPGLGLDRFLVAQRELDAIRVARPGGGVPGIVGQFVGGFQVPSHRVLNPHSARSRHQLDEPRCGLGRAMSPRQSDAKAPGCRFHFRSVRGLGTGSILDEP